jgi:hypothetical protein
MKWAKVVTSAAVYGLCLWQAHTFWWGGHRRMAAFLALCAVASYVAYLLDLDQATRS